MIGRLTLSSGLTFSKIRLAGTLPRRRRSCSEPSVSGLLIWSLRSLLRVLSVRVPPSRRVTGLACCRLKLGRSATAITSRLVLRVTLAVSLLPRSVAIAVRVILIWPANWLMGCRLQPSSLSSV